MYNIQSVNKRVNNYFGEVRVSENNSNPMKFEPTLKIRKMSMG
jgi:hypothetical protein